MFAVPGWAVSSSNLVAEKPRSKEAGSDSKDRRGGKGTKKRKRDNEHLEHESTITTSSRLPDQFQTESLSQSLSRVGKARKKSQQDRNDVEQQTNHNVGNDKVGDTVAYITRDVRQQVQKNKGKNMSRKNIDEEVRQESPKSGKNKKTITSTNIAPLSSSLSAPTGNANLTPLQAKMRSKLTSARFRHLNETLYTTSSSDAYELFSTSPELFADYHAGFAQQVKESWPQNPVDTYVKAVKTRGSLLEPARGVLPLPRRKTGSCTIADLGCGDAPLARGCQAAIKSLRLKFHNYDLHAANTLVTKADIANLPLRDGEADIAVFCLSLMGTNWISFVEEAWRIIRGDGKGEVWVAEVKSRFGRITKGRVVENSVGKMRKKQKPDGNEEGYNGLEQFAEDDRTSQEIEDETDITSFIKVFTRRGFQLREGSTDKKNKMFVSMIFTKTGIPTAGKHKGLKWTGREYQKQPDVKPRFAGGQKDDDELSPEQEAKVLKPCVYKTR